MKVLFMNSVPTALLLLGILLSQCLFTSSVFAADAKKEKEPPKKCFHTMKVKDLPAREIAKAAFNDYTTLEPNIPDVKLEFPILAIEQGKKAPTAAEFGAVLKKYIATDVAPATAKKDAVQPLFTVGATNTIDPVAIQKIYNEAVGYTGVCHLAFSEAERAALQTSFKSHLTGLYGLKAPTTTDDAFFNMTDTMKEVFGDKGDVIVADVTIDSTKDAIENLNNHLTTLTTPIDIDKETDAKKKQLGKSIKAYNDKPDADSLKKVKKELLVSLKGSGGPSGFALWKIIVIVVLLLWLIAAVIAIVMWRLKVAKEKMKGKV